jgi:hypothetical protein
MTPLRSAVDGGVDRLDAFYEMLCAEPDLLRMEFDELVAETWPDPSEPPDRGSGQPAWLPLARGASSPSDGRSSTIPTPSRQTRIGGSSRDPPPGQPHFRCGWRTGKWKEVKPYPKTESLHYG